MSHKSVLLKQLTNTEFYAITVSATHGIRGRPIVFRWSCMSVSVYTAHFCLRTLKSGSHGGIPGLGVYRFFFAEYCCPDPLFEDSGGCGGVTLGQF